MKEIPLTKGYVAIVDDEDYEWLSQWKWRASVSPHTVYAIRWSPMENGKRHLIHMHREILGAPRGTEVDHIDRDGLNNTRENLRLADRRQNLLNRRPMPSKTSKYRGVHWDKARGKWFAAIRIDGKKVALGRFDTAEDAARAYDKAAAAHNGDFAVLNLPHERQVPLGY